MTRSVSPPTPAPTRARLTVEPLEDRSLPSGSAPMHLAVHPGESIQAAVDRAAPGAEIDLAPGTYAEAVTVGKPGIRLTGRPGPHGEGVVLANPGDEENGVTVTDAGDGFALRNVTVRGFEESGVLLTGVDRFALTDVTAENDGEYGFFPIRSSHGTIDHCTASGHSDIGLYVGQSRDVVVRRCTMFANVVGIGTENCSDVRLSDNESYDNTAGILVTLLPGLAVTTSADVLVDHNSVHDNNRANFAEPGEIESFVPAGIGILVLGTDRATVRDNHVTGNHFVGIGVGSSRLFIGLGALPPAAFAGVEPNPDGARVLNNVVTGNGGGSPVLGFPPADLLWDGSGTDNVWAGNRYDTSSPSVLPGR